MNRTEHMHELAGRKSLVLRSGSGTIEVINLYGDERSIVNAARVSLTLDDTEAEDVVRRTIERMRGADPAHTVPFEFAEAVFRVRAPIFVSRQWLRHRTASAVEKSGRRTQWTQDDVYDFGDRPDVHVYTARAYRIEASHQFEAMRDLRALGEPTERANRVLGTNWMSTWVWKVDLHNLLGFLALRLDRHAQWEIRQYAKAIDEVVSLWVPTTHRVFHQVREERASAKRTIQELRARNQELEAELAKLKAAALVG